MIDRLSDEFPGRCAVTDVLGEGYILTKALLEKGHLQIAYCGWPPHRGLARRFLEGVKNAIKEKGGRASLADEIYPVPGDTSSTLDRFGRFLSQTGGPSAVVCNDDWTTGMVALLAENAASWGIACLKIL